MDLFAAVIQEGGRRAVERYRHTLEHTSGTTRDKIRALAAADAQLVRENEDFLKVVIREAMSFRPETYPLIIQHLAPFLEVLDEIFHQGLIDGTLRSDKPLQQLGLAFFGTLSMLYVQHWGSQGAWPSFDEIPDLATTLFLDGAGHNPPSA